MYYLWYSWMDCPTFILIEAVNRADTDKKMEEHFPGKQFAKGGSYYRLEETTLGKLWPRYLKQLRKINENQELSSYPGDDTFIQYFDFIDLKGKLWPVNKLESTNINNEETSSTLYEIACNDLRKRIREEEKQRPKGSAFEFL